VIEALITFTKDGLIFLIIIVLLRNASTLHLVIWTLLAGAIFLGTISVYQQITGSFANDFWGFGGANQMNIVGTSSDFRIGGPLLDPNAFGRYMLLAVPLAIDRFWNEEQPLLRALAAWAFTVSVLAILFTFSRGSFLALVIMLVFLFVRRRPSLKVVMITAVIALLLIPFVPDQYTERLFSLKNIVGEGNESFETDYSLRGRVSENLSGWMMFTDHPFLGVGLNNFDYHYQSYSRQLGLDPRREERAPHNLYLEYMSELGIVGITWLIALQVIAFRGLWRAEKTFRQLDMTSHAGICVGLSAVLVGYLASGIFLHVSHPRFFWMLYGLIIAIPVVAKTELEAANTVADA
jgi:O-antigen ligase